MALAAALDGPRGTLFRICGFMRTAGGGSVGATPAEDSASASLLWPAAAADGSAGQEL